MRTPLPILLLLASCTVPPPGPHVADGVSESVLHEMRALADAPCPKPPEMPVLDGTWYVGWFGKVVGIAEGVLAVQMEKPQRWSDDVQYLLMPVEDGHPGGGIKGDAVVVGRVQDTLICRYFPSTVSRRTTPTLGDRTFVDHATSLAMREAGPQTRR